MSSMYPGQQPFLYGEWAQELLKTAREIKRIRVSRGMLPPVCWLGVKELIPKNLRRCDVSIKMDFCQAMKFNSEKEKPARDEPGRAECTLKRFIYLNDFSRFFATLVRSLKTIRLLTPSSRHLSSISIASSIVRSSFSSSRSRTLSSSSSTG